MSGKVAIIGKGKSWVDAPYDIEAWGITQLVLWRYVDLVIDMNVYDDLRWGKMERMQNMAAIQKCKNENIPYIGLGDYPKDKIVECFNTDYFSNTVDYAIALALYRGYKQIDLYGINFTLDSEYAYQKPGMDFWCGVAKGMGVRITSHGESELMKTKDRLMYGYDTRQA